MNLKAYLLGAFLSGAIVGLFVMWFAARAGGQLPPPQPPMDRDQIERRIVDLRAQRDLLAERREQIDQQIVLWSGRLQQADQHAAEATATAKAAATPTAKLVE